MTNPKEYKSLENCPCFSSRISLSFLYCSLKNCFKILKLIFKLMSTNFPKHYRFIKYNFFADYQAIQVPLYEYYLKISFSLWF